MEKNLTKNFLKSNIVIFGILLIIGGFFLFLILTAGMDTAASWMNGHIFRPAETIIRTTIFRPIFLIALTIILILERLIPVRPEQKTFSVGFTRDSVWLVIGLLFEAVVVSVYTDWLRGFTATYLSFLTIESVGRLPESGRVIV